MHALRRAIDNEKWDVEVQDGKEKQEMQQAMQLCHKIKFSPPKLLHDSKVST